ncbi:hypothetical protein SELMODRAFT_172852 [Selaginella moellendorffii]|uniref:Uncharacterized protein n=1 Tax=Selaginella moellendorffii TaxID=88036 RepID=D8RN07_SELML|nr:telomerase Cajal body protein 1 isoform X2 [Selaginella moellendorffii]EFJ26631.1 hypothetical protein SELMODRAFT_172852 [Selaginella moellendorffii]|eukprot:XP_002972545.1 telomerase Cajal body protein 1 isoform X2 [Selaginella moellendorffii]
MEEEKAPAPNSYLWCPRVHFDPPPQRLYHLHRQFRLDGSGNNFFKGVKWSPDGSCFLTCNEDKTLRIFDLPSNALEVEALDDLAAKTDPLVSSLTVSEGETVYDFCWYPHMVATDLSTCVFATTTRDHPVHLWDAATGNLRCSYRAYNAMDEVTAALSVAFNPAGNRLFCGYKRKIRIFDTSTPGRHCEEHSTLTSSKEGITGIVSCLAFSGHQTNLLAAGSYDRTIAVYNEGNMELLYVLQGHEGGLTQVQFSKDGNYLYSGARKDPSICCWDVRYTTSLVYKLERAVTNTNQRIAFDIEPYAQHLGTGGEDGDIRFYDLRTGEFTASIHAASDTINGFSFHPTLPLAASTSGARRFSTSEDKDDDEEPPQILTELENCASVWRFSCSWEEIKYEDAVKVDEETHERMNVDESTIVT